ncbi:unnamed protein product [Heligmosomoides polygyrus]|uniref:DDE Tnp4 domain-containing protein n=1 Tax=Heligmosomoides polygyrus TaxID=6339 RepID=A0A3P7YJS7_HELPZ|nr:unnamed protein product [Heligmosomoides polygyrus]
METKMLRWTAGVTHMDHIRNDIIRQKFGIAPIADKMREARLRWYGHVLRGDEDSVRKIGLNFEDEAAYHEPVFGILTSRFRVLNRLHGNPENVKLIINSMVLHNLLVHTVTTDELLTRFPPNHVPINQGLNQHSRAESRPEAQLERTRLMEYFASRNRIA